ncbi:MAG: hypothetical protein HQ558_06385 [Candidatus Omnitrophica bacterium]|nr:hypothetical protein [Candidatus Omnitrophota bacterium]
MRKILLLLMIIMLFPAWALAGSGVFYESAFGGYVPAPRIIKPASEEVDLTGKKTLEFKWSRHEGSSVYRKYYDFRLYDGYKMVESTLILKKRVDPSLDHVDLDAALFKTGNVYTWGLRQVYRGNKSRQVHYPFKVIRK